VPRIKLTKSTVDAAMPREKEFVLWDSELTGFGVRIRPTGAKSFIAVYRTGHGRGGLQRKMTIGPVGAELTADTARKVAKRFLGAAAKGDDPALDRTQQRRELTVAHLCDLYLAEGCNTKKLSTITTDQSRIERHIKPLLGYKRIGEVLRGDVDKFLRDVASGKTRCDVKTRVRGRAIVSGGKGAATRTVGLLGGIFSFAVARGLLTSNPVLGVKRFPDRNSQRFLSANQLVNLGVALRKIAAESNPNGVAIIKMLAFTGTRKSEITRLMWSEVDLDHRCLRLTESKTGSKILPLGPPALELLSTLFAERYAEWVFPSRDRQKPFTGLEKIWDRVRNLAGYPNLRIHDLRHSFASMGLARGNALTVIGALLGHSDVKTTARYAHLGDDPLRAAVEEISGAMANAMSETPNEAEVVQLGVIRRRTY
jgi:integrase